MNKLKLIGILVLILLIFLITITSNNKDDVQIDGNGGTRVQVEKENATEVYNSGGSILEYNGYIYYVNTMRSSEKGFSNKVCRRKIGEDDTEEVLYDAKQYRIEDRLMIFNNNIFFSVVGQTYYINLENTNYIERYNQGVLYYINDGNLIFVYDNNIYKAEYYPKTLAIKTIKSIASVNATFLSEDDENLYFYNNNYDNSKSIISVNKEKKVVSYLDKIYSDVTNKLEILDHTLSENYIYLTLTNVNDGNKYEIRKIPKTANEIKVKAIDNIPSQNIYAIKDNLYFTMNNVLYEYDETKDEINETKVPKNAPEIYELKLNGKNVELYKNNELFVTILKGIDEQISDTSIEEVGDCIYLKFYLRNSVNEEIKEMMFWQVKKDGSDLIRLNDTF